MIRNGSVAFKNEQKQAALSIKQDVMYLLTVKGGFTYS